MRKRKSTRFKVSDGIIVFLCLGVAVASLVFFIRDLYAAQTKQNEEPIAIITFKQRSAQRKFMDRVIWDRVQQNAPIYNGDILRTAPLSEATIYFSDGNIIDMYENTMVQVFYNDKGAEISMSGSSSNITITTENSKNGLSFISDQGTRVDIDSGSVLSAKNSEQALAVQVETGTAQVTGSTGNIFTAQAGNAVELTTSGQVIEKPITVLSPLSNTRLLNYSKNKIPVLFSWKKNPSLESDKITLEIAEDKNFNAILWSTETPELSAEVQLENGSYYWRFVSKITTEDTTESVLESSKLNILSCPTPVPIVPSSGYEYSYRNKLPVIRFLWDGNNYASAYEMEIADNPEMSNPVIKQRVTNNSGATADLGPGNWYWRVTPYYTINNTGLAEASEVTHFVITKISDLKAPVLAIPIEDHIFTYNTKQTEPTIATFSWKAQQDASYYTLLIADNTDMTNPIIENVTSDNFYKLPINLEKLTDGDWYWSVYQTDFEGNTSPLAAVRKFSIIQGEEGELKTLYPPNNYSALSAYSNEILFAWKSESNLEDMHFQTSATADFSKIEINTAVSENTLTDIALTPGNWYWRISGNDGNQEIFSDSRQITILSPYEGPELLAPVPDSTIIISDTTPITISWKEIPTADYYNITLTAGNKNYSFSNVKNTSITTFLPVTEDLISVSGTIQAFSNETDFSSALYSEVTQLSFYTRKPFPVELLSPANEETIPGLTARHKPTFFTWNSEIETTSSRFLLYVQDKKGKLKLIETRENPNKTIQINTLPPGNYSWTMEAQSILGTSISAKKAQFFTVLPIPPLHAPVLVYPAKNQILDSDYLRNNQTLTFKWKPVTDATEYVFTLFKKGKLNKEIQVLKKTLPRTTTEFTLKDLTILDVGTFIWKVEPLSRNEKNEIEQNGIQSASDFTIEIPIPKAPVFKFKPSGKLYGN